MCAPAWIREQVQKMAWFHKLRGKGALLKADKPNHQGEVWALRGKSSEGAAEVLSLQHQQQWPINECCAGCVRLCSSCWFPKTAETPPWQCLGSQQH